MGTDIDGQQHSSDDIEEMRARLREYEEVLQALRGREADATAAGAQPYRVFIERMNEGAVTLNPDGTILYCNSGFASFLGQPPQKLTGSSIYDAVASPAERQVLAALLTGCDNGIRNCTVRLLSPGNDPLPVNLSVSRLQLDDSCTICMVVTDLTLWKENQTISAQERLTSSILDQAGDSILVCDDKGYILRANRMANEQFGENLLLQHFDAVFPFTAVNADGTHDDVSIAAALCGEQYRKHEVLFQRNNAGQMYLLFSTSLLRNRHDVVVGCVVTLTDISGRKKLEEELVGAIAESERRAREAEEGRRLLDAVLTCLPEGLIFVDAATQRVRVVSKYITDFAGRTQEDFSGITLAEYAKILNVVTVDNSILLPGRMPVWRSLHEGESVTDEQYLLTDRNGKKINVLISSVPLRGDAGVVVGAVATWRDITELKAAEEVLRRNNETHEALVHERTGELLDAHRQLERSRRMSDIGRFASTIAHELRNPLSAIRMAVYNIKRKSKDRTLVKHLEHIDKKVLESDDIIKNLLAFTRIKAVNPESVRIRDFIRDCVNTVVMKYAGWEVAIEVAFDCGEEDILEADCTQLKMLVSNIIDNAFQALPEKTGRIKIAVSFIRTGWCEIAVTDNGSGMDKEVLAKIFDPFYTTKSKGTGLGLAVCREIVELHKGKIEVLSTAGKGTTFTIILPRNTTSSSAR
jgi:PAS domain S-box-containing protein